MGINRQDVQMVNSSLKDLGDSLLHERMMQQQQAERESQDALKQQQIGVDQERWNATQQHQKRLEATDTERFRAEQAHQGRMEANQLAQQNQMAQWHTQQQDQQTLKDALTANAQGQLDDKGRDQINSWLEDHPYFSQTGLRIVKPPERATRVDNYIQRMRDAGELEAAAQVLEDDGDTATAADYRSQAKALRDSIPNRNQSTVTETSSIDPLTQQPVTKTTRKYPAGTLPPTSSAASPVIKFGRDPKTNKLIIGQ